MKLLILLLSVLIYFSDNVFAAGVDQTHENLPTSSASFMSDLQTFLKKENGDRFKDLWASGGFIVSGCTHGAVGSLTATPSACTGYPGGYYATEVGSVTYTANKTCWTILNETQSGNLNNFTRQGATHYLVDCTSVSKPSLPANSAWLMEVTTNGGSVTAVSDIRTIVPDMPVYKTSELPAAGNRGRMAFVTDSGTGTIVWDNGSAWVTTTQNPMTSVGDVIVGGASGVPTRMAIGTSNQLFGVNNAGSAEEWKTLSGGSGISITNNPNAIAIAQTIFPPTGSVTLYAGTSAPSGWLLCDGSSQVATTYSTNANGGLFDILLPNIATWGRGTAVGVFTANTATDILTLNAHGKVNGDVVHVANAGGGLPAPLTTATKYYIITATLNTFQLSLTSGGAAIDITTTGSGTNSLYDKFLVPDGRGRAAIGTGTGSGLTARSIGTTTGTETISIAQMPAHNHTINVTDPGHSHTEAGDANNIGGTSRVVMDSTGTGVNALTSNTTSSSTTGITASSTNTGSGAADGNMMPVLVFTYIIKT